MKTTTLLPALLFTALGALSGCGRPYEVATPNGFVDFSDRYASGSEHEYRAATADGVVIGVRAFDNDPKADMALAVRALENRVRVGQGYALLAKREVTARNGSKGTLLEFGHDETGGPHLYDVAIFLDDRHVYLIEAGGKKDLVEKAKASIDWTIQSFLPK